ncbi:hypothetical protein C8R45DRAFT_1161769 [Mycena sanguinolenta]|nr:hypothetical protein C8R45DRAFT_1161769 [Mycena sanguinolenta]
MSKPATQSLPECETGLKFPVAWLTPSDKYVIDISHWNKESPPEDAEQVAEFSVRWNRFGCTHFLTQRKYGVEIIGLIIRLYFDLPGCIIPVAYVPDLPEETFIFTIAGECNADNKKDFYLFHYDEPLSRNSLQRLEPAFSSIPDFYRNCSPDQLVCIPPRADREVETFKALIDCEFLDPRTRM